MVALILQQAHGHFIKQRQANSGRGDSAWWMEAWNRRQTTKVEEANKHGSDLTGTQGLSVHSSVPSTCAVSSSPSSSLLLKPSFTSSSLRLVSVWTAVRAGSLQLAAPLYRTGCEHPKCIVSSSLLSIVAVWISAQAVSLQLSAPFLRTGRATWGLPRPRPRTARVLAAADDGRAVARWPSPAATWGWSASSAERAKQA